jgi:DNA-binding CsgD family transcriptional regulator
MDDQSDSARKLIHICAVTCGVEPAEVYSASRRVAAVLPRQIACYVAATKMGMVSKSIARTMNRDHSTVLHAIEKVEQRLRNNCLKTQKLVAEVWEAYQEPLPPIVQITEVVHVEKSKTVSAPSADVCDEIKKLRARGLPINRIAERLGANEYLVAKLCGVSFWKHKNVNEVLSS